MGIFQIKERDCRPGLRMIRVSGLWKQFRVYPKPRFWLYEKLSLKKKIYHQEIIALRDVSFSVEPGECLGIIGKNGAGKSTLLRVLAGISHPSKGEVEVQGRIATLLELGSGFHPEFTGRENLRLNGMIAGFTAQELEEKVSEMIEFSELGSFIDLPTRTYSDGMYLRLGFSLAQALEPEIFLIDEALAVGDEYFRSKCLRRMREFKEKGTTLLIASHDLTMIRGLCDRAIYLRAGRLEKIGAVNQVLECYLDEIYQEAMGKEELELKAGEWKRRGRGEARIISVRVLNQEGAESRIFRTGEQMSIEFEYQAFESVKEPLFGINIFRTDGVLVLSTNQECATLSGGLVAQKIENELGEEIPAGHKGKVSYQFQNLLLPGQYQVSVNIFKGKSGGALPVDEVFDALRFEVISSKVIDRGVFLNPASWKIS